MNNQTLINPFALLGITTNCTFNELKRNYYKMALLCHPDRGGNSEDMKVVHKAYKYRIKSYAQIHTIDELKHSLFVNGPCMIAFPVYHMEDDMWKPRDMQDIFLGGHAMTVVGYNNIGFIIRNSW